MVKDYTTLIIGAGASTYYGFPTGTELCNEVIYYAERIHQQPFGGDVTNLRKLLASEYYRSNDYLFLKEFANDLRGAKYPTIDEFIYENPKYNEIAKLIISYIILDREKKSKKLLNGKIKNGKKYDDWLNYLWVRLKPNDKHEFNKNHLTIFTFNYDRLIEFYIIDSIKHLYNVSREEAFKLKKTPIFHVYGQTGSLDPNSQDYIPYGEIPNETILYKASKSIKLMYDEKNSVNKFPPDNFYLNLEMAYNDSSYIYFLGFGYDKFNMQRIDFDKLIKIKDRKILGTAYRMGAIDKEDIINKDLFDDHLYDCTCLEFLQEYAQAIRKG